ncbi:MAG: hypothetical protein ACTSVM_07025 [Candidatus Ranarchaeia archaeon]
MQKKRKRGNKKRVKNTDGDRKKKLSPDLDEAKHDHRSDTQAEGKPRWEKKASLLR